MSLDSGRRLTLDDIADLRAYERERAEFRARIIELKRRRRVGVGPFVTFVFENRDTIRFQIQEMARVEKLSTDAAIQTELDIYNPLIPDPGHLSATLFIELTSEQLLREWLPRLVGIERSVLIETDNGLSVRATVDAAHDRQLTRSDVTASVHYVGWALEPAEVDAFARAGEVRVRVDHPAYAHAAVLAPETVAELLSDLH